MQSMTMTTPQSSSLFPPLTARIIATALMAGLASDLTWEFWARVLTPLMPGVDGPLEPAALVQSVFGLQSRFAGEVIHFVVGVAFYPLGYLYVARPLQRLIIPGVPWFLTALGFGAGLFVFALYIMAHLIAGFPAFLGWVPLAWCSLFGHLLFGLITGFVVLMRERGNG